MKLQTCQYTVEDGWDKQPDTSLDSLRTLVLLFGTPDIETIQPQLDELTSQFNQSIVVGCSSAGEIFNDDVYDESISVSIIQFENTQLKLVTQAVNDKISSKDAGNGISSQLTEDDLRSVLILSDGLAVNGTQLINGMIESLPPSVVITGGLAGDGDRFEQTWVWANGELMSNEICAIGFYGDSIRIGHGSRGGWDILGPEREVTRSSDNVLYELDGQPALQLYKEYLGERAEGLPATGLLFPLAISNTDNEDSDTVRTILAVNEDDNSITFAGDIPQGKNVRLMRANFDRLIDGAADAADDINLEGYNSGPLLAISISCVGRRLVLGPRTEEEIDAALSGMPEGTEQIGFYSYGEISPLANGRCDLHNQTMTITALWEQL